MAVHVFHFHHSVESNGRGPASCARKICVSAQHRTLCVYYSAKCNTDQHCSSCSITACGIEPIHTSFVHTKLESVDFGIESDAFENNRIEFYWNVLCLHQQLKWATILFFRTMCEMLETELGVCVCVVCTYFIDACACMMQSYSDWFEHHNHHHQHHNHCRNK